MAENTTTYGVKFFKGWYGKGNSFAAPTGAGEGAIIFNEEEQIIYVNGKPYGGATDVSFADGVLTIKYSDGRATQTLDFNDTASAGATLKVFERIDDLIGENINVADGDGKLNYTGTNYLSEVKEGETVTREAAGTLVEADKRLDTAIKAVDTRIDNLDTTADVQAVTMTAATDTEGAKLVFNGVKQTDGAISAGSLTSELDFAKVATTGKAEDVKTTGVQGATYNTNTTDVSADWRTVISDNELKTTDDVETSVEKLDNKVAGLADEVVANEKVINSTISTIKSSVGLEDDFTLDITGANYISGNDTNVKAALTTLDTNIKRLDDEIDGMDLTATDVVAMNDDNTALQAGKIKEEDGKVTIETKANVVEFNKALSATNKVATMDDIKDLDVTDNIQSMTQSTDATTGDVTLTFKGTKETDGKIEQGEGTDTLVLKKVATTGKAEDVTYDDTTSAMGTTENPINTVQKAIERLDSRLDSVETVDTFDTVVSSEATNTPNGVSFKNGENTVTGTLAASADTMHKIYLVPDTNTSAEHTGTYNEYISVRTGEGETATYTWELIGSTKADLTGYVKTIKVNGKEYTVAEGTTTVTLGDVITTITGEEDTELNNTDYINVKATTADAADGSKVTTLSSSVKTTAIADAKAAEGETAGVDGLATALDVKNSLKSAIEALDADYTGDKAVKDDKENVTVSLKEEDGKVTSLGVDVAYATVTTAKDGDADTTLTVADGDADKLVIGSDVTTLAGFTNTRIAEEIAKLDSTVTSETIADGAKQTSTVKVDIVEEDGKLKSVSTTTLGADVAYTAAVAEVSHAATQEDVTAGKAENVGDKVVDTAAANANLTASNSTGAVLGSDVTAIKNYVDATVETAKAASSTTVTNSNGANDAISLTSSVAADGHTNYDVNLVWSEWAGQQTT